MKQISKIIRLEHLRNGMKQCYQCKEIKLITEFYKNRSKPDGYHSQCKQCRSSAKERNKELIYKKTYRDNNKDKIAKYAKEYKRKRLQTDGLFLFKKNIRCIITNSLRKQGYTKTSQTAKILGCSFAEFKTHIEQQFELWMNWDNHGAYNGKRNNTWQYDHITPLATAMNGGDVLRLNHYTNFQPLCSFVNQNIKKATDKRTV